MEKSTDPNANYAVGFGMQYKVMDLKAGFQALDVKEVSVILKILEIKLYLTILMTVGM